MIEVETVISIKQVNERFLNKQYFISVNAPGNPEAVYTCFNYTINNFINLSYQWVSMKHYHG